MTLFIEYGRDCKMQRLHLCQADTQFGHGALCFRRKRSLFSVCGMQESGRLWYLLMHMTEIENGGSVEPPCDFHCIIPQIAVNKGIWRLFCLRAARARAPPCARQTEISGGQFYLYYNPSLTGKLVPVSA